MDDFHIFLIAVTCMTQLGSRAEECPGKSHNGVCYIVNDKTVSWSAALEWCQQRNMSLASVKTEEENDWLYKYTSGTVGRNVWIGGKKERDGEWYWTADSSRVEFSNWAPGQPDQNQECMAFASYDAAPPGTWDNELCSEWRNFCVCASETQISTTTGPATTALSTPGTKHPKFCYISRKESDYKMICL